MASPMDAVFLNVLSGMESNALVSYTQLNKEQKDALLNMKRMVNFLYIYIIIVSISYD